MATVATRPAAAASAAVCYQLMCGVDVMIPPGHAPVPSDTAVNGVPAGPVHSLVNANRPRTLLTKLCT